MPPFVDGPLRLPPVTLTQVSSIKIATHVWRQSDIKQQVKEFLQVKKSSRATCSKGRKAIFTSVFEKIDQLTKLPAPLARNLKFVTMQLGINVFQWLAKIWDYNEEDFIDILQWDQTGCVDAARTYRSAYRSGKVTPATPTRMIALHTYCLEDCIDDYWRKIPRDKRKPQLWKYRDCFYHSIFDYWTKYIDEIPEDPSAATNCESEAKLFCVRSDTHVPYQSLVYFWNKSTDVRQTYVVPSMQLFWNSGFGRDGLTASVDGLGGLIERMETEDPTFCGKHSKELEKFIIDVFLHWTWLDLFLPMISEFLGSIDPDVYYHALHRINEQSYIEYQLLGDTQRYHDLTMKLWRSTPKYVKLAINSNSDFAWHVLDILKVNDVKLLREIFTDEDLSEVRRDLLNPKRSHWCYEVRLIIDKKIGGNSEIFENFVQQVLLTDKERKWFTSAFYSWRLVHLFKRIHKTVKHNEAVLGIP